MRGSPDNFVGFAGFPGGQAEWGNGQRRTNVCTWPEWVAGTFANDVR
jgi:hypothetical protein